MTEKQEPPCKRQALISDTLPMIRRQLCGLVHAQQPFGHREALKKSREIGVTFVIGYKDK